MKYDEKEKYLLKLFEERDRIQLEIERVKKESVDPCCWNCQFMRMGKCTLNNQIPPEKIKNNGCECFEKDKDCIPF